MFVVDGMSVNDPLAGGGYGYQIDPSIINEIEVLTGGFNAEYGQAVSGVVNVTTKEGTDRVEGKVSFKRDYLVNPVPKNDYRGWRRPDRLHRAPQHRHRQGVPVGPRSHQRRAAGPGPGPAGHAVHAGQRLGGHPRRLSAHLQPAESACESPDLQGRLLVAPPAEQLERPAEVDLEHHAPPQAEHQRQPAASASARASSCRARAIPGRSWTTWTTTWCSPPRTS